MTERKKPVVADRLFPEHHAGSGIDVQSSLSRHQNAGSRIDWTGVLDRAREIVASYDTSVTLRQLYYRLVAEQLIPNKDTSYKRLSSVTAVARRDGGFPELLDRTRSIHAPLTFTSPGEAIEDTARWYRRDRTEGQPFSVYLGVEKNGIVVQLESWFGQPLGVPILAFGGYASQSYVDEIVRHVHRQQRPAVLLYAGDHDPSGWDIPRDFEERTGCWDRVIRVALDPDQIAAHELPEAVGKETDSRKTGFIERFGALVQVELDALPPETLRTVYADAFSAYWDSSIYERVVERERTERAALDDFATRWSA